MSQNIFEQQIANYLDLLEEWNKIHNLTAIRERSKMLSHHIADSLSVLDLLPPAGIVVDVGTGAGLPGIPLAIYRPNLQFYLIDSRQKKINFVQLVIKSLKLTNVTALPIRVESLNLEQPAKVIISRAFSNVETFAKLTKNLADKHTVFMAMKGKIINAQQEKLPPGFELINIQPLTFPGMDEERCIVLFKKGDSGGKNNRIC
jgi:16S rRNA (guanine527-N7)-methyltransferase